MAIKLFFLTFLITSVVVNGARKIPRNCPQRLKAMDENLKVGLIVTNPNQKLYENERELNEDYCM